MDRIGAGGAAFIGRLQSALTPRYPRCRSSLAPCRGRQRPYRCRPTVDPPRVARESRSRLARGRDRMNGQACEWADYGPASDKRYRRRPGASWRFVLTNPVPLSLAEPLRFIKRLTTKVLTLLNQISGFNETTLLLLFARMKDTKLSLE